MRMFPDTWTIANIAGYLHRQAALGVLKGTASERDRLYTKSCTAAHQPNGSLLILTRESGYHTSGWWKNPDYERCLHLSLSFRDPATGLKRERDKALTKEWLEAVFGPLQRLLWCEGPFSPEGKSSDVWHYRVFYAPGWVAPILPRGEVYTKTWTPADWKSWSDVQADLRDQEEAAQ